MRRIAFCCLVSVMACNGTSVSEGVPTSASSGQATTVVTTSTAPTDGQGTTTSGATSTSQATSTSAGTSTSLATSTSQATSSSQATSTSQATTTSVEPGEVSVDVGNFSFGGGALTVGKGTRVRWRVSEGSHTVTSGGGGSPDGLFDSGTLASGEDFDHTFDTAGTFNYFCKFHWASGMVATVTVSG